jgi:hypothetical protein
VGPGLAAPTGRGFDLILGDIPGSRVLGRQWIRWDVAVSGKEEK